MKDLFICILICFSLLHFHRATGESYIPKTQSRTAVIISGQFRSGNISMTTSEFKCEKCKVSSLGSTATPIETVHEFLLKPLALYGGVDLFIYFSTRRTNHQWDGDPRTFEHYVGDVEACKVYANHPMFHPSTGNKVFCQTAYEHEKKDYFAKQFPIWKSAYREYSGSEPYLHQLYGHYMGNLAAKEYSVLTGTNYTYKVRLRPDAVMWGPIPEISTMKFNEPSLLRFSSIKCTKKIFIPDVAVFGYGCQDSFDVGEANDMDYLLDRYMEHMTKPYVFDPKRYWTSEEFAETALASRYGICLTGTSDFLMSIGRFNRNTPAPIASDFEGYKTSDWSLVNY